MDRPAAARKVVFEARVLISGVAALVTMRQQVYELLVLAQDVEKGEEFSATFDLTADAAARIDAGARAAVYQVSVGDRARGGCLPHAFFRMAYLRHAHTCSLLSTVTIFGVPVLVLCPVASAPTLFLAIMRRPSQEIARQLRFRSAGGAAKAKRKLVVDTPVNLWGDTSTTVSASSGASSASGSPLSVGARPPSGLSADHAPLGHSTAEDRSVRANGEERPGTSGSKRQRKRQSAAVAGGSGRGAERVFSGEAVLCSQPFASSGRALVASLLLPDAALRLIQASQVGAGGGGGGRPGHATGGGAGGGGSGGSGPGQAGLTPSAAAAAAGLGRGGGGCGSLGGTVQCRLVVSDRLRHVGGDFRFPVCALRGLAKAFRRAEAAASATGTLAPDSSVAARSSPGTPLVEAADVAGATSPVASASLGAARPVLGPIGGLSPHQPLSKMASSLAPAALSPLGGSAVSPSLSAPRSSSSSSSSASSSLSSLSSISSSLATPSGASGLSPLDRRAFVPATAAAAEVAAVAALSDPLLGLGNTSLAQRPRTGGASRRPGTGNRNRRAPQLMPTVEAPPQGNGGGGGSGGGDGGGSGSAASGRDGSRDLLGAVEALAYITQRIVVAFGPKGGGALETSSLSLPGGGGEGGSREPPLRVSPTAELAAAIAVSVRRAGERLWSACEKAGRDSDGGSNGGGGGGRGVGRLLRLLARELPPLDYRRPVAPSSVLDLAEGQGALLVTCLAAAAARNRFTVAQALLGAGADPDARVRASASPVAPGAASVTALGSGAGHGAVAMGEGWTPLDPFFAFLGTSLRQN